MRLRLRDEVIDLSRRRPLVMGILNANPDSVSDVDRGAGLDAKLSRAHEMLAAGADIVDVGGDSGRTDVPPVSVAAECARVVPVVSALAEAGARVSIDTARAAVARAAVDAGACLVNDVSGLADEAMLELVAASGAGLVVMETRAAHKEERFPGYRHPVAEVREALRRRLARAVEHGVAASQLIADPGLDYSKTPAESLELLRGLEQLTAVGRPLLLAVSNKYFVGVLTDREPHRRLGGTLAALDAGVRAGAAIVRVHDVPAVVDFLTVRRAIDGGAARLVDPHGDDRLKWLPA